MGHAIAAARALEEQGVSATAGGKGPVIRPKQTVAGLPPPVGARRERHQQHQRHGAARGGGAVGRVVARAAGGALTAVPVGAQLRGRGRLPRGAAQWWRVRVLPQWRGAGGKSSVKTVTHKQ